MKLDLGYEKQVLAVFKPLTQHASAKAFPRVGSLSALLEELAAKKTTAGAETFYLPPNKASLFATASVDAWSRAVHSFLVSVSLSDARPIWAGVSGYYSSHYSMRAIAHLFGHFLLYNARQVVCLRLGAGKFECEIAPKKSTREHQFYWRTLRCDPHFASDILFTENREMDDNSDCAHRNRANYADHIWNYPYFRELDRKAVQARVRAYSQTPLSATPIPSRSKFPDITAVQMVAYHRLVRFRRILDETLGASHKFWKAHRNPLWVDGMMDFQLAEQTELSSIGK